MKRMTEDIRRFNLIISGIDFSEGDPKTVISNFLTKKFNVKPAAITGTQKIGKAYLITFNSISQARLICHQ